MLLLLSTLVCESFQFSIHPARPHRIVWSELSSTATSVEEYESTWKENVKVLCAERNIPFDRVKNARDLSSVNDSPVKSGRVYRMGKVTDATKKDVETLFDELHVRTLVDLRSRTELRDEVNGVHADVEPTKDEDVDVFKGFTDLTWYPKKVLEKSFDDADAAVKASSGEVESTNVKSDLRRPERHFVSLMNEFKYVKGTLKKLRKRDLAKAVLKSPGALVSKRIRSNIKGVFLKEINEGGLPMLNELVLSMAGPGIKYVLNLCADKNRHPVAIYCTAGKDRTGIIASIILAAVGAADKDIVEDYSLSANVYAEINDHKAMVGALSQRNLDAKTFLTAPPEVMQQTLDTLRKNYGSIEGYLDEIGFDESDRLRLIDALIA